MLIEALCFIAEEVRDRADRELDDDGMAREELTAAYELLETGAIGEEEFDRRERAFLARLNGKDRRRHGSRPHEASQKVAAKASAQPQPPSPVSVESHAETRGTRP
ncbi:MAG: gas vesicle protein GvpG [Myxococcota bacterium]|nr:gas vesicle protein GvpG [Myxococcota bacterium]